MRSFKAEIYDSRYKDLNAIERKIRNKEDSANLLASFEKGE